MNTSPQKFNPNLSSLIGILLFKTKTENPFLKKILSKMCKSIKAYKKIMEN